MQWSCKRTLTTAHLTSVGAFVGFALTGQVDAQNFVGGGNGPTFDTTSAVSVVADSGTRDPIGNIINGNGMLSKTTHADAVLNNGASIFTLFRNAPFGPPPHPTVPPNPTGLPGPNNGSASNWVEFDLGSVVPLQNMWIWNWNEDHGGGGDNTRFGWQFAAIQTSINGTTWSAPINVTIPEALGLPGEPADLIVPIGTSARYLVLANQGYDQTLTYGGDDTGNDAGLSEVRFEVPEPASLGLLTLGALGVARRRK